MAADGAAASDRSVIEPAHDRDAGGHGGHEPPFEWTDLARIAAVALAAAAVWFRLWEPFPPPYSRLSPIGIAALAIGCWPIFREAFENLLARRMTMELSMSIAIVAAAAISEVFTALVITLFVLIAEVLEGMTVARGRRAIRDLVELLPSAVSVRRDGRVSQVDAATLVPGDQVLVNPGGRVPVDGCVVSGLSFVDEAPITGESMPLEKSAGARVFAGSINQSGALEIRAERIGRDTSYGKIIEAVEQAERSRAPVQRLADRMAGYLVYFALGAALLTWLLTRDVRSTISVVIVAGACGIAAGTPLAILGAIGRAARAGAIVKGGLYLEQLGRVDTVVLDKTGTLTYGQPQVQALICAPGVEPMRLLDAAASAELRSEHPLGRTLVACAQARQRELTEPERFDYTPGRGITATVAAQTVRVGNLALMREHAIEVPPDWSAAHPEATMVYVARAGSLLGAIAIADRVRPQSRQAIEAIRRLGIRTVLLTGDRAIVAEAIGDQLGITDVQAELMPEDKRRIVRQLVGAGRSVAMVGDGVNDAPALVEADVGVAMGSGTDVARESADVVLLGNDLMKFAETLALARRTRHIIWANFAGTLGVDAIGIGLAAAGFLNPLLAAFIHVASELVFILNSARLVPVRASAMVVPAMLCVACTVGPDFERPAPPQVQSYVRQPVAGTAAAPVAGGAAQSFSAGAEVPLRWWTGFGSAPIDRLVERAFEHNPTVDAARAALRQAHESTAAQFGARYPVVQASYALSRAGNAVGTIAPTLSSGEPVYTLHTAQASVGFVPDVFGLNRREVESLEAQEEARRFQLEATYLTLASNVVAAAIQQAALQAQADATEDIIRAERRTLELLREQARLGYASTLDVASQESALARAEQALPPLRTQLEQTRDLLAVLAGELPAQGEAPPLDLDRLKLPEELPLSVPSKLVEHRPDVRAAEALVHSASAEVGVAVANRLPQFPISAAYGGTATQLARMFADGDRFWAVNGSVAQTLFDFGALRHRQRAAEAALDRATAQYRSVVLVAFQNVADSLYALAGDADALAASVKAEDAARRALDLTRRQLDAGAVNVLALLGAQQAWQQARISRVQAQAARYTDTVALYQALGGASTAQGALARESGK